MVKDWRNGAIVKKINFRIQRFNENRRTAKFLQNDLITIEKRLEILHQISTFSYKPLISIVMPVYDVDEKWLRLGIESVKNQLYQNWEFCIADDCSPSVHIKRILDEYAAADSRFKIVFRTENGHISAASNSALELATGEFTALLDHDDELSEDALFQVVKELNVFPQADLIYGDQDKIDENQIRSEPNFKPVWNPNLFYSMNYLNHLSVYRTEILRKIGGFRIGFEGSQDYDLAVRVIEEINEKNIRHIPKIIYHWRAISGSLALGSNEKSYAHSMAKRVLIEHFERQKVKATIEKGFANYHRVIYNLPENILFEVINLRGNPNLSAKNSTAAVLIFVADRIETTDATAFTELTSFAVQKNIGAAGGKILNRDSTINNCGIWLTDKVNFINRNFPSDFAGNLASGQVIQNVDAVSEVLAVRRELFEKLGGFDLTKPDIEIDFCRRLHEQNHRIVFTPYAEFIKT